jgi:hypothetical protein
VFASYIEDLYHLLNYFNILSRGGDMPGGSKTERELLKKLERWRDIGTNRKLIHTVNNKYLKKSKLVEINAEHVFNSWDVISCSLVDIKKMRKHARDNHELASYEHEDIETGLWFELGFVLDVPPQNILGTHSRDVWFPNHAGMGARWDAGKNGPRTWALVDAILSGRGLPGGEHAWPAKTGHSYNRIRTPDDILHHSDMSKHNEILVIGKSDINIYSGFKPTGKIKVSAIIVAAQYRTGHALFSRALDDERLRNLNKLRRVNPTLPVIEV